MLGTLTWHVTRASGVVAYALLAAGMLWGLALSTKLSGRRPPRPWMLDVHRMLGALALGLTAVHVAAILLDSFVAFDVADVLLPFASDWNPAAVALGVIALYLLVAVEVTSLLRQRISQRMWRRVHYSSFVMFLMASGHFIAAGTDASSALALGVIVICVVSVVALTVYRIARAARAAERRPASAAPESNAVTWSAAPPPPPRRRREAGSRGDHPAGRGRDVRHTGRPRQPA
jgi:DMSO/TMAO reductase YedYZ heme-binding membrane subunit